MKVNITKAQLQAVVRADGCDCSDRQWLKRGDHCTMNWIRCRGRAAWKPSERRRDGGGA